jgi:hypothetical protein
MGRSDAWWSVWAVGVMYPTASTEETMVELLATDERLRSTGSFVLGELPLFTRTT